jgi:hypothetical protein
MCFRMNSIRSLILARVAIQKLALFHKTGLSNYGAHAANVPGSGPRFLGAMGLRRALWRRSLL